MKRYSIIIPTWNSPLLGTICDALRCQTTGLEAVEVLIVGADESGAVVEDETFRYLANSDSMGGATERNIGMRAASGEIVLFLDHDCVPAADWLAQHLHRHAQGEQIVGGAVTFGTRNYLQLADNVSAYHDLLPFTWAGERLYLSAANLSVRRDVVAHVGAMREDMRRAEDLDWSARLRSLGYRLYFEPRAVVWHDPPRRTWRSVWRHWTGDAHDTLRVRLHYADLLRTPSLARQRWPLLWAAPLVAAWATARTFNHPQTVARYWHTLPLVYLTKLAWCWGGFKRFPTHIPEEDTWPLRS